MNRNPICAAPLFRTRPLALVFLIGFGALTGCKNKSAPQPPPPSQPTENRPGAAPPVVYTATLTPEERRDFYHLSEGGELLPLDILRAVESIKTFKPFMEDLGRFRLIADPEDPDGLPVGMSVKLVNGQRASPRSVFFNCAACHSADMTYRGRTLRIDGAPAQFDMAGFVVELLSSIDSTLTNPERAAAFLSRLSPKDVSLENARRQLDSAADALRLVKSKLVYVQRLRGLRTTTFAGYGRLDAFVAARNLLFGDKYQLDVNSPVSLPPIFGMSRLRYYHYDNNTNSILQRNIGEDLGVGAVADMNSGESTVEVRHLLRLEDIARRLPVPRWPEEIFGPLDSERVRRGALLYQKECAACHEAAADGTVPDRVIELSKIGTDANRLLNFSKPIDDKPFSTALAQVLDKVERRAFERDKITAAEAARLEPPQIVWRTTAGYSCRPIDGVFATAPYLHNGSVPTLYDLLLPPAERPKTFLTGGREFDPRKVGYVTDGAAGATFLFDTTLPGNHNGGHVYGTTLAEPARLDLLEYLKSR